MWAVLTRGALEGFLSESLEVLTNQFSKVVLGAASELAARHSKSSKI